MNNGQRNNRKIDICDFRFRHSLMTFGDKFTAQVKHFWLNIVNLPKVNKTKSKTLFWNLKVIKQAIKIDLRMKIITTYKWARLNKTTDSNLYL